MTSPRPVGSYLSMATLLRGVALVCGLVFLAGLGGCVSADEHKRLLTAFDESQVKLATADNDLAVMRKEIGKLNDRIAMLNDALAKSNGGLGALDDLRAKFAELQKKYNDLLTQVGSTPVLPVGINTLLRDLVAMFPNDMEFDERLGMIRMKSDFTFAKGSTEVSPEAKRALARLAQILNDPRIERNEIQVDGHTDDIPITQGGPLSQRNPDNWTLSTNRAWSVLSELRSDGVKQDRGMASGWGDQRPVEENAPNRTGNVKNRRVDIYIRPTTVPVGIVVSSGAAPAPRPVTTTRPATTRPATPRPGTGAGGVPLPG